MTSLTTDTFHQFSRTLANQRPLPSSTIWSTNVFNVALHTYMLCGRCVLCRDWSVGLFDKEACLPGLCDGPAGGWGGCRPEPSPRVGVGPGLWRLGAAAGGQAGLSGTRAATASRDKSALGRAAAELPRAEMRESAQTSETAGPHPEHHAEHSIDYRVKHRIQHRAQYRTNTKPRTESSPLPSTDLSTETNCPALGPWELLSSIFPLAVLPVVSADCDLTRCSSDCDLTRCAPDCDLTPCLSRHRRPW